MLLYRLLRRGHALVVLCLFGTNLSYVAAQETTPTPSQLGGWVYVDKNNDGVLAFANDPNPELTIPGVQIRLFSLVGQQETLLSTMLTDSSGRYLFTDLSAGTYVVRETQPTGWIDGLDTLGSFTSLNNSPVPGTASAGTKSNDVLSSIVLPISVKGDIFNFGERGLSAAFVSKRYLLGSSPTMPTVTEPPPSETPSVPEPASLTLALAAVAGTWLARKRRFVKL